MKHEHVPLLLASFIAGLTKYNCGYGCNSKSSGSKGPAAVRNQIGGAVDRHRRMC
jgi:hypothetical protein